MTYFIIVSNNYFYAAGVTNFKMKDLSGMKLTRGRGKLCNKNFHDD
jgi:hypothetical protein